MSIDSIVLFLPPISKYGWLNDFTIQIKEAFERQGVRCTLIGSEIADSQELFKIIFNASPDCTLSFNGLLPDEKGQFFCDLIQIPHVACLVDSPKHFFSLSNSPYTIITCVDRHFCNFFRHSKPEQVLFMPHAVEKDLYCSPQSERVYDVVMLATCIDIEKLKKKWNEKYPPILVTIIEEAVEIAFSEPETFYMEAFSKAIEIQLKNYGWINPRSIDYESILSDLENYICGMDRIEMLKSIPKEISVHVFGEGMDGAKWEDLFPQGKTNVITHGFVTKDEAQEIMKKTKVLLNNSPTITNGAHERIFNGIACGALLLTNDNPYMREQFVEGEEILFFQPKNRKNIMPKLLDAIKDEAKRCRMVEKAYAKVKDHHTWDVRAKMLLTELPTILEKTSEES